MANSNPLSGAQASGGDGGDSAFKSRPQGGAAEVTPCPESVPAGGVLPYKGKPMATEAGKKPFKGLKG